MRLLVASTLAAAAMGLAGLVTLGAAAWPLVVPLATLAAAPLLPPPGPCPACRSPTDGSLAFCPGCAR